MRTKAIFHRKETCFEPGECEIEKVICLSDSDFARFQQKLLDDYDFLHENAELMRMENGVVHCLLVVGETLEDGVLVNSEGSSYARYAAYFPNAKSFLLTHGQAQEVSQAEAATTVTESPSVVEHEASKMRVLTQEDLEIMYAKHILWCHSEGGAQADFSGCQLTNLDMRHMQLNGANFTGALLENMDMAGAGLCFCVFRDTKLVGCNLNSVVAEEADFCGASFTECKMRNGIYTHSNFAHAQVQNSDLRRSDFSQCCIEGADIMDTEIVGVNVSGTSGDEEGWVSALGICIGGM